jgi:HTH-type transcriptional regulator/antitoxin HigA
MKRNLMQTSPPPREYERLVRMFPLRPVRTRADYDRAIRMIDMLAGLEQPTRDQSDYLEVLSNEVERYEHEREPIDDSGLSPLDSLKYLLEEHDMTASDLGRLLGNRQLGSAILRGERSLSKAHIALLAEHFRVEPGLFIEKPARRSVA